MIFDYFYPVNIISMEIYIIIIQIKLIAKANNYGIIIIISQTVVQHILSFVMMV